MKKEIEIHGMVFRVGKDSLEIAENAKTT